MIETRLLPAETGIEEAIRVLRDGGLVAFPTDTVYGLGAHALLPHAVERIYLAKARPRGKAIPLLVADAASLETVASAVPESARKLAAAFWPGALTIVLHRAASVPEAVTQGAPSIAVRAPSHPIAQALIRGLGAPIAATSANISGSGSLTTAQAVFNALRGRIELVLDGGASPIGVESSIVDLCGEHPRILRQGAIPTEAIEAVLAPLTVERVQ